MGRNLVFIVLTLFFSSKIISQNTSGVIIYKVHKLDETTDFEGNEGARLLSNKIAKIAKDFLFRLTFNKEESIFQMIPYMGLDKEEMTFKIAKSILRWKNIYFLNKKEQILLTQKEVLGELYLIEEDLSEMEWNITNETKKIENYTCYKAIGYRTYYNRENELKKSSKIAWFCPELPNLYGPFEAVGLPGLVLEFQVGQYGFVASNITLSKENMDIKKPSAGKITTQKELNENFMKLAQDQN